MKVRKARNLFQLDDVVAYFNWMLFSAHPEPVREEIRKHRRSLNTRGPDYFYETAWKKEEEAQREAALCLGLTEDDADMVALTGSTTMGLAQVLNGLRISPGHEMLRTDHEFFAVKEIFWTRGVRDGVRHRSVRLYDDPARTTAKEIVSNLRDALREETRVLVLTWVHSSTGVKLPMPAIAAMVAKENAWRPQNQRIVVVLDAVHGFGVENATFDSLGCDFFVAGCHKWIFGPRGTGIVCGRREAWKLVDPIVPSFISGARPSAVHTPGGIQAYEHRWALAEALRFHREKLELENVEKRTRKLTRRFKKKLHSLETVELVTPDSDDLSAAIVCLTIPGIEPPAAVKALKAKGVVCSVSSTGATKDKYVRFSISALNREDEIDRAVEKIGEIVATGG